MVAISEFYIFHNGAFMRRDIAIRAEEQLGASFSYSERLTLPSACGVLDWPVNKRMEEYHVMVIRYDLHVMIIAAVIELWV